MKKNSLILYLILSIICISSAAAEEVSVVACGDIMLGRYIGKDLAQKGYSYPYTKVKDIISSADIAFANLECPISLKGEPEDKEYCFRADPKVIKGLNYAGFDVLSLANNHTMDYGKIALQDTIDLLTKNGILSVGAGKNLEQARKPAIIKTKGMKIAFLAYDCTYPATCNAKKDRPGACPGKVEIIQEDISRIRKKVDIVIVSFHWGVEYQAKPAKTQIKLAHQTIDAGADLIIGHHPHVLQGIEFYKERPILYSLGNFIFDQTFGNTRKGIVINCVFKDKKLHSIIFIPIIRTYATYYPQIAREKEREEIISHFLEVSKSLNKEQENLSRLRFKE